MIIDKRLITKYLLLAFILLSHPAFADGDSSFEKIMKTGELRCAYASLSPFVKVDPISGKISGMFPDILNEIGNRINVDIKWVEEVNYPQIGAGLISKRYDAFCGVLWATPVRGRAMKFTDAIYYQNVSPCVSGQSTEYDKSVEPLNKEDKTMIGYDGDVSSQITRRLFPKAKFMSIPDNISFAEAMQWIASGKVDAVATCGKTVVDDFNQHHPNAIKVAAFDTPITRVKIGLALPLHEQALADIINLAIFDMQADGTLFEIMLPYMKDRMKDTIIIPSIQSTGEQ